MKTALYDRHCSLGAKMVDFSGWEMPIQYKGILLEHQAVRENVGIFDVSHMGRILVQGPDAEKFLDYLSTNHLLGKKEGTVTYTVWSLPQGGCVDDVLIYKEDAQHFFVIVNAGNRQKDLKHLLHYSQDYNVVIQDCFEKEGILSIQGPKAQELMSEFFPEVKNLKKMHFINCLYKGKKIILSATGYTGSDGFEIYGSHAEIIDLWDSFLARRESYHLEPIGLGARDSLRLEMGFALYGHEINENISANESVAGWAVKWDKEFLGKEALEKIEKEKRFEYGILLLEKRIARENDAVFQEGKQIGYVTSGTYSPTLNQAIGIVLVDKCLNPGDKIDVQIRQASVKGQVIQLPFYKRQERK